ncbi:NtaA/DmoA family FMN-dependent monooxygenase [Pseudonocardia sp. NPDC049635]|uniref:NtaA/DmoA family FMN-dependent monooxygenase n=1 Tax=Pseudonocardia sp. NPDC049635 TaxID=3155506 RepID=UPI003408175E
MPFRLALFSMYGARHWDLPQLQNNDWRRAPMYVEAARMLETRGGLEAIIFADGAAIPTAYKGSTEAYVRYGLEGVNGDAVPLLAAIATSTRHIGLMCTMSTSLYPPYLLARILATLDHLSGGRAGWNLVTSVGEVAKNFGADALPEHDERYDRAEEFLELVTQLWDSWAPGAVLRDRDGLRFADPERIRPVNYEGTYHRAAGPLTVPRPPQRRPTIMQAGSSERGRDFAAKNADMIICIRNSPEAMKDFRDDIRERARSFGRNPDSVKVFFTVRLFVGDSYEDALALRSSMIDRATVNEEVGLANYSYRAGYDFNRLPLDEPLPADFRTGHSQSMVPQYTERGQTLTLREIALAEARKENFHLTGTPKDVADGMVDLMEQVGGDGIAIRDTNDPTTVTAVVDRVIPLLRARGAVRSRYRYSTLRENLLDPEFTS